MTKCFLDFDHTLFATDRLFYVEIKKEIEEAGIDLAVWREAYREVWSGGYTMAKHVEAVNRLSGKEVIHFAEFEKKLRHDLRHFVYPDVEPFLKKVKEQGIQLYLLSFGSPEWQKYKVTASGLSQYFDDLFITTTEGKKVDVIAERADGSNIIMVDNNPEELDFIRDIVPGASTYWIERVTFEKAHNLPEYVELAITECKRYLEKPSRHPHIRTETLKDVILELA